MHRSLSRLRVLSNSAFKNMSQVNDTIATPRQAFQCGSILTQSASSASKTPFSIDCSHDSFPCSIHHYSLCHQFIVSRVHNLLPYKTPTIPFSLLFQNSYTHTSNIRTFKTHTQNPKHSQHALPPPNNSPSGHPLPSSPSPSPRTQSNKHSNLPPRIRSNERHLDRQHRPTLPQRYRL